MGFFTDFGKGFMQPINHVIGQAKTGVRSIGHAVHNYGDYIDIGTTAMTLGGAAMVATGVGAPMGLGMIAASKGIGLAKTGINVAQGDQSLKSAATEIATGYVMGQGLGAIGGKVGGKIGKGLQAMA